MKIYLIRLKDHPEHYIGKQNPSYGLSSDNRINEDIKYFKSIRGKNTTAWDVLSQDNNVPHWFVSRKRAKIWENEKAVRQFVNRYNKGETFSEYEVEIDDAFIIHIPLDDFMQNKD